LRRLDLLRLGLRRQRLLARRLQPKRGLRRGLRPGNFGRDRQDGCREAGSRKLRPDSRQETAGSIEHVGERSLKPGCRQS
jgi:hypothetical protein